MRRRALLLGTCLAVVLGGCAARPALAPAPASASIDQQVGHEPLSRRFQAAKTDLVEATGIGKNALHFLLGGLVFAVAALALLRFTRRWALWAGALTLGLALVLELLDWSDAALVGKRLTLGHALKDVLLTTAVAIAVLVSVPLYRRLRG